MASQSTFGQSALLCMNSFVDSILCGKRGRTNNSTRKRSKSLKNLNLKEKNSLSKSSTLFTSLIIDSLAINLIEKLCNPKPSARYKVDQALLHPWVTRNFDS